LQYEETSNIAEKQTEHAVAETLPNLLFSSLNQFSAYSARNRQKQRLFRIELNLPKKTRKF